MTGSYVGLSEDDDELSSSNTVGVKLLSYAVKPCAAVMSSCSFLGLGGRLLGLPGGGGGGTFGRGIGPVSDFLTEKREQNT